MRIYLGLLRPAVLARRRLRFNALKSSIQPTKKEAFNLIASFDVVLWQIWPFPSLLQYFGKSL